MTQRTPQTLNIRPLAPYEDRLLNALAFFRTQRQPENQAHHCLSMYLRQSEARIMGEVGFYARLVGMEPWQFLELLYQDGDRAEALIQEATGSGVKDTFEE